MPEPLSTIPTQLIIGDTLVVRWTEPSDLRVADSWVHTVRVQAMDGTDALATAVASDGALTFTLSATNSAALTPGAATWAWTATKTGERYTLGRGTITLVADPSGDQTTTELAHVRRVIAACEARLEGKVTDDVLMFQLPDGVMLQKLSLVQIQNLLASYRAKERRLISGGRSTMRVREAWYAVRH